MLHKARPENEKGLAQLPVLSVDYGYFGEEASFMHALRSDILAQEQRDLEEARLIQDDHEEVERRRRESARQVWLALQRDETEAGDSEVEEHQSSESEGFLEALYNYGWLDRPLWC